jgi:hypothetical protein
LTVATFESELPLGLVDLLFFRVRPKGADGEAAEFESNLNQAGNLTRTGQSTRAPLVLAVHGGVGDGHRAFHGCEFLFHELLGG